ncbi:helix-turn-helix domain-containing protein [bacterium]|nr:helix-turn-helix domain-containing protein [bacterium]
MHMGFYAIIPATVRYDNRIPANAKLLYGEITALCNERGYCWATNAHFAELYDVKNRSITNWLGALEDAGYIQREEIYEKGTKRVQERRIYIVENNCDTPSKNFPTPLENNFPTPTKKSSKGIIQVNNKTNNIPPQRDEVVIYINQQGFNVDADRWFAYYESNGWKVGRNKMKDWKACIRTWQTNGFNKKQSLKKSDVVEKLTDRSWAYKG